MPGQNAARTMIKHFRLEDTGGRLGALKSRLTRERVAQGDPYASGQNDPLPGELQ